MSLHQVVAQRYMKTSIVMTTNCGVGLCAKFGDNTVSAAMLDRLPDRSACSTSAAIFTGSEIKTPDWRNSAKPPSEPATHYSETRSRGGKFSERGWGISLSLVTRVSTGYAVGLCGG